MSTNDVKIEFAKYFTQLYNLRSLSKAELSRLSGVSEATLSRVESGTQKPSPDTLKKLAPILQVSEDELMYKAGYLKSIPEVPKGRLAYLLRSAEELTPEDQEEIGDMLQILIERRRAKKNEQGKQD